MRELLVFVLIGCASCSLFDGMKKSAFEYTNAQFLPLLVPKGYKKTEVKTDSAGNKVQLFSYADGGTLYFAFGYTTKNYQTVDTTMNIAKFYPDSILFYKGQNSNRLFWRESRYENFRFGYRNISSEEESAFDSSVNYAGWQIIIKGN